MAAIGHSEILRSFDELQAELREWWKTSTEAEKATVRANIDSMSDYAKFHGQAGQFMLIACQFALLGMHANYVWYNEIDGELLDRSESPE